MGRSVTSSSAGQVLVLDPATQLLFHGPFTNVITTKLRLSNPSERRVCFKIKSNVPRQYCVHPSIAVVLPNDHVDVSVMLQPVSGGARPDADCAHKFIVEAIFTPDGELTSLERLWQQAKTADVMYSKLFCVFNEPAKAIYNGPAAEPVTGSGMYTDNVTSSSPSSPSRGISTFLLLLVLLVLVAAIVYKCLD